ncbi:hypothetical protein M758_4G068900 [Ceratodon purpureus]|nr:hypothetical protein M758_4G068900 [Ceratodon purpureus]
MCVKYPAKEQYTTKDHLPNFELTKTDIRYFQVSPTHNFVFLLDFYNGNMSSLQVRLKLVLPPATPILQLILPKQPPTIPHLQPLHPANSYCQNNLPQFPTPNHSIQPTLSPKQPPTIPKNTPCCQHSLRKSEEMAGRSSDVFNVLTLRL